jgi:hypothetical protein
MKLWLIFIQGDDTTWLEAAWDDQSISESPQEWADTVQGARITAKENSGEIRIATTEVTGIYELFDTPTLSATPLEGKEGADA